MVYMELGSINKIILEVRAGTGRLRESYGEPRPIPLTYNF